MKIFQENRRTSRNDKRKHTLTFYINITLIYSRWTIANYATGHFF